MGTDDTLDSMAMFRRRSATELVRCGSRRRLGGFEVKGSPHRPMDRHLPPLTCRSYKSSSALSLSRQPLRGGGMARCCKKAASRQTRYTWTRKRTMSELLYLTSAPPALSRACCFAQDSPRLSINRRLPNRPRTLLVTCARSSVRLGSCHVPGPLPKPPAT